MGQNPPDGAVLHYWLGRDAGSVALEVVAAEEGASFVSAADWIPADQRLFSDATHFSLDGERMFATSLSGVLADLMAPVPAVTE